MSKNVLTTVPPSAPPEVRPSSPAITALQQVLALTRQGIDLLGPHYRPLSDDERQSLGPVPHLFAEAGPDTIDALHKHQALLAFLPDFDLAQVQDDLARANALRSLENFLEQLLRTVHDSQRMHESRAFTSLLPVYNTAKTRAAHDAGMRAVIRPMQKMFDRRGTRRRSTEAT